MNAVVVPAVPERQIATKRPSTASWGASAIASAKKVRIRVAPVAEVEVHFAIAVDEVIDGTRVVVQEVLVD
jgi:hypothetical protein